VRTRAILQVTVFSALSFPLFPNSLLLAQAPDAASQHADASTQDSANELSVGVGKSVLVDSVKTIQRIAVGAGDFADATAISPSEILINGKAPGETSLIVWEVGGGRQFFNVKVRANTSASNDRIDGLRKELKAELPGQPVRISSENGLIFIHGTVNDLTSSDRAMRIASTAGKVVNLLYVKVPPAEPQILLKVRFASFDRTLQRQLGINLFSLGTGNTIGSASTQQFSPPSISNIPGTAGSPTTAAITSLLNLFIFRPDLNLGATIEALQTDGVLEVLAEPNLLTSNGKEGSFLAGGEYPYPVVQGSSGVGAAPITVQFKEFGVRLDFIPTITPRGTIRLQVAPEVSSLDFANGLTISGFTVPALSTRRVNTEVELQEGQSFAIGGLLDNRETKNFSKVPFIGDIPVLGKFFQSISTTKKNTELIVIVTPEIVAPIPAGAPLPAIRYPDKFLPANSNTPLTNPVVDATGGKSLPAVPATMPVEELVQSMQSEKPLVVGSMSGGASSSASQGGGVSAGSAMSTPSAPQ
jgi:pilus assembly protein CpaC